jgi:hypothetical protein
MGCVLQIQRILDVPTSVRCVCAKLKYQKDFQVTSYRNRHVFRINKCHTNTVVADPQYSKPLISSPAL